MTTTNRTERIPSHDSGDFSGYLALPAAGRGPGMVLIQEIFGVNGYIKAAADRLAGLGYVTLAPDLYWRIEPGVAIKETDEGGLDKAFSYMGRLDFPKAADDAAAALEHLRKLPEVKDGKAGILGFCLGGGIAYFVAASSDPDTTVSYYGSAVPGALELAGNVKSPILFHFGTADGYIPAEKQEAVKAAFAGHPDAEFHLHPGANHAFDNHVAPMFHHPEAAKAAWEQTTDFLKRTLPP